MQRFSFGSGEQRFLGFLIVLCVLGCSGPIDNRYVHQKPPSDSRREDHAIKELHGQNKVDILWVIDNSYSMQENQNQVKKNAREFIDNFVQKSNLQWKLGLLSTDERNHPFLGFRANNQLDWQTPNPVPRFQSAVASLGIQGMGLEKFFTPTLKALRTYPGFLRDDAVLAVVVVSDEDEQSDLSIQAFMRELIQLKGGKADSIYTYGLFASSTDGCDSFFAYRGSKYQRFINESQGKHYSLCDANIGKRLAEMGQDLVQQLLNPRMFLNGRPVEGSLKVFYRGEELPAGSKKSGGYWLYEYSQNAVVFHDLEFAPDENESVQVEYESLKQ